MKARRTVSFRFNRDPAPKERITCGVRLDGTLEPLEETRFKKKYSDLIVRLSKELHFTIPEIESLLIIHYKFQKEGIPQTAMTMSQFKDFLHKALDMTDKYFVDTVTYVLYKSAIGDVVSMETWVRALSLFLRGTFEEKTKFCYSVYDKAGAGKIPRESMFRLLEQAFIDKEDPEDIVRDFIEVIVKKMDSDRDGMISYKDFKSTVEKQPLMMEAFGQCLPSRLAVHAFLVSFTQYSGKNY